MIILNNCESSLLLPRVDRCENSCNGIYQLIFHHLATKQLIIYKVRDWFPCNPAYYRFEFFITNYMQYGEYKVYLIRNSDWYPDELKINDIAGSIRYAGKDPVSINGHYIISNGKLLMTRKLSGILTDHYKPAIANNQAIIVNYNSCDDRAEGDICEGIDIISTYLAKYLQSCTEVCVHEGTREKQNIQYKRHER